ncbi:hypothetical protein evm_012384 [Chilo suppressalis]|nr:hypothetical protein evm_012384 [Chilo suppressalis]
MAIVGAAVRKLLHIIFGIPRSKSAFHPEHITNYRASEGFDSLGCNVRTYNKKLFIKPLKENNQKLLIKARTLIQQVYVVVIFSTGCKEYVSAAPKQWLNTVEGDISIMWPANTTLERKAIKLNMTSEHDWLKYENVTIGKRKIKSNRKYREDSISPLPEIEITEHYTNTFPTANDIINAEIILDSSI